MKNPELSVTTGSVQDTAIDVNPVEAIAVRLDMLELKVGLSVSVTTK